VSVIARHTVILDRLPEVLNIRRQVTVIRGQLPRLGEIEETIEACIEQRAQTAFDILEVFSARIFSGK
jgi:hypothetical protein